MTSFSYQSHFAAIFNIAMLSMFCTHFLLPESAQNGLKPTKSAMKASKLQD